MLSLVLHRKVQNRFRLHILLTELSGDRDLTPIPTETKQPLKKNKTSNHLLLNCKSHLPSSLFSYCMAIQRILVLTKIPIAAEIRECECLL